MNILLFDISKISFQRISILKIMEIVYIVFFTLSLKYSVYFTLTAISVQTHHFQVLNTCMWLEATALGREALKSNWVELEAA